MSQTLIDANNDTLTKAKAPVFAANVPIYNSSYKPMVKVVYFPNSFKETFERSTLEQMYTYAAISVELLRGVFVAQTAENGQFPLLDNFVRDFNERIEKLNA